MNEPVDILHESGYVPKYSDVSSQREGCFGFTEPKKRDPCKHSSTAKGAEHPCVRRLEAATDTLDLPCQCERID